LFPGQLRILIAITHSSAHPQARILGTSGYLLPLDRAFFIADSSNFDGKVLRGSGATAALDRSGIYEAGLVWSGQ
jgi:hypothetical protein